MDKFEYNLDYYSGAQAAVFVEDILIDEITTMQWSVQQAKVPIYGYASQTFDEMARGTLIVQGSFSINFVEAGYLWASLNRIKRRKGNMGVRAAQRLDNEKIDQRNRSVIQNWVESSGMEIDGSIVNGSMIDIYRQLASQDKGGGADLNELQTYVNDYIWGSQVNTSVEGRFGVGQGESFQNRRRTDRKGLNGFDIYLRFNQEGSATQTVTKIEDVHLLGKAQTVVIDENPVQEVYSFYAKNVI